MHLFYDHVAEKLQESVTVILSKNLEDKKLLKNTKNLDLEKIQSFYASDIYRSLFTVIELLSGDIKGQLLYQVIKIVVDKLQEVQTINEDHLRKLSNPDELIISCVYVLDANNCIEAFPDFKKKIKSILQKDFHDRLKITYSNIRVIFNGTVTLGCRKTIELIFLDLENKFIRKLFTNEWNEEVLTGVFESFKEYFNRGLVKILKHEHILVMIEKTFIENFINYYVEEIIHSLRSLNRKTLGESELTKYKLKYLKLNPEDLKYSRKETKEVAAKIGPVTKNLDKFVKGSHNKKTNEEKFKKYEFPVKNFNKESKQYNPAHVYKLIIDDIRLFKLFLDGFKENAKDPFSKKIKNTLGDTYIEICLRKLIIIKDILSCTQNSIPEKILQFKESYHGFDGKVLLEALLYAREDSKATTKPDCKKYFLMIYEGDKDK
jgi:hypothetical protein